MKRSSPSTRTVSRPRLVADGERQRRLARRPTGPLQHRARCRSAGKHRRSAAAPPAIAVPNICPRAAGRPDPSSSACDGRPLRRTRVQRPSVRSSRQIARSMYRGPLGTQPEAGPRGGDSAARSGIYDASTGQHARTGPAPRVASTAPPRGRRRDRRRDLRRPPRLPGLRGAPGCACAGRAAADVRGARGVPARARRAHRRREHARAGYSHFGAPGDLDLGGLGLILDTGHAAICGTLHDFLREPHAELAHVHLHDNRGPADAGDPHLPLGRGVVDTRAVLRAARASGATVILELLSEDAILESIAHLDRKGLLDEA